MRAAEGAHRTGGISLTEAYKYRLHHLCDVDDGVNDYDDYDNEDDAKHTEMNINQCSNLIFGRRCCFRLHESNVFAK